MEDRADLLDEALRLVTDTRNVTHGPPVVQHETAAALWSAILGRQVTAAEVVRCLIALKLSRMVCGTPEREHWLDIAGYAAIGWECDAAQKGTTK